MDPILKFCIEHPDVDVSFVGYECKGEHKTVKIELCTINNGKPFRSSRTIGYFEAVKPHLEDMYKELKKFIKDSKSWRM